MPSNKASKDRCLPGVSGRPSAAKSRLLPGVTGRSIRMFLFLFSFLSCRTEALAYPAALLTTLAVMPHSSKADFVLRIAKTSVRWTINN